MNILQLSKTLSKEEFSDSLDYIKEVNDAGFIMEFLDSVEVMNGQGTDLASSIYYSWYDLMIDSGTGKFKTEVESALERSGKNRVF